jgi:hypothetical protein
MLIDRARPAKSMPKFGGGSRSDRLSGKRSNTDATGRHREHWRSSVPKLVIYIYCCTAYGPLRHTTSAAARSTGAQEPRPQPDRRGVARPASDASCWAECDRQLACAARAEATRSAAQQAARISRVRCCRRAACGRLGSSRRSRRFERTSPGRGAAGARGRAGRRCRRHGRQRCGRPAAARCARGNSSLKVPSSPCSAGQSLLPSVDAARATSSTAR